MANFYGKDRETDFAAAKLMSFGKSFSRMNGQPLDESEVWYNKAELEAFAAGNSAYVGMKLVYVDETNKKVYQYSVQYDGSIKEIGVAPLGDNKSIVVDAETGTVSLKGIDTLAFERDILDEDGEPTGDKESVQYQPLMTKDGLVWVEPSKTTVEGLATLIDALDKRTTALETAVGDKTEGTGLYALINAKADATNVYTKAETDDAIDNAVAGILGEGVDEAYNTLKEIQDILEGTNGETIDGLIETVADNKAKISTLNGDATTEGSVDKKIADAITAANLGQYTTEDEVKTIAYVKDEVYTKSEADSKIDEKIASVTGGESAADVKLALESYRDALNKEVWGDDAGSWTTTTTEDGKTVVTYTPAYGTDSRIDKIEAKANTAVQDVQKASATDTKLVFTKGEDNIVKVDDSALVQLIAAADEKATAAGSAANANLASINGINENLTNNYVSNTSLNNTLTAYLTATQTAETYLNKTEANTTYLTQSNASETYLSKEAAASGYAAKGTVDTLVETVEGLADTKADASALNNYYTKEQIGTFDTTDNKTLVSIITSADTANKAAIETIYKTGEGEAPATGLLATLIGADTNKSARTIAGEEVAKIIDNAPEAYDTLKEIADWIANDETGAAAMSSAIAQNTADIKAITDNYKVKDVDNTTLKLDNGIASVKAISTDLLVQGTEELIFKAGNAGTKTAE